MHAARLINDLPGPTFPEVQQSPPSNRSLNREDYTKGDITGQRAARVCERGLEHVNE